MTQRLCPAPIEPVADEDATGGAEGAELGIGEGSSFEPEEDADPSI